MLAARLREKLAPQASGVLAEQQVHARRQHVPAVPIELALVADGELIEYVCENERDAQHMVGRSDEFQVPLDVLAKYVGTYESTRFPGRTVVSLEGNGARGRRSVPRTVGGAVRHGRR